jgi:hypothetical protein
VIRFITVACAGSTSLPGPLTDTTVSAGKLGTWRVITGTGTAPGKLAAPTYLAVDKQDNVYVSDTGNHRIQKLSPDGQSLAQWGTFGDTLGQFKSPTGISVDSQGNIYVADMEKTIASISCRRPEIRWRNGVGKGASLDSSTTRKGWRWTPKATSTSQTCQTAAFRSYPQAGNC